tara:strand:+ start:406 stop:834 length:429 start_codon:yes stop_codon:yes gene_type:complete
MTIVEWINQILVHKTPWENFDESEQKTFSPFIVNRWLSMDNDFLEIVNFFQKYSIGLLDPKDTYKWYCDVLPKGKRFNRYIKGKKQVKYDKDLISVVCKHYETSKKECVEYIELLKKSELISMLELYGKEPKQIKKLLKGKK